MPAKSKAQQRFMGLVNAAQKGEGPSSPAVAEAAQSMTPAAVKDFAATKTSGLPEKAATKRPTRPTSQKGTTGTISGAIVKKPFK